MSEFHPFLEKLLAHLGLSPAQVRWRWYRQKEAFRRWSGSLKVTKPRHKFCPRCGHLARVGDRVCPQCQRPLPTFVGSKVYRYFQLNRLNQTVTFGFLGLIAAIFCIQLALTHFQSLLAPTTTSLLAFGAFATQLGMDGEYWRVLTMGLAHIGIIHIVFNLMAISQVLGAFEGEIGPWPTVVLITVTQLGAVAMHALLMSPNVLTAGASGIAFGLIGFGAAYFHRMRQYAQRRFFLRWFLYGLVFGLIVRANNAAHLGGFLTGLPLGWLLAKSHPKRRWVWRTAGMLCLAAWIVSLGFLARSVFENRLALTQPEQTEQS
jgi:rhomboid protease GluP